MKNYIRISVKQGLLILLFGLLLFCVKNYKGIPNDIFKKIEVYSIDQKKVDIINSNYKIKKNKWKSQCDDPNITLENCSNIRSIKLRISDTNVNTIKIYYSEDKNFTEDKSMEFELKLGNNIIILPYSEKYNSIRIDLGEKQDDYFIIDEFKLFNKFIGIKNKFVNIVVMYFLISMVVIGIHLLNGNRENIINVTNRYWNLILEPLYNYTKKVGCFIEHNKFVVITAVILTILTFTGYCTNYTLSIDEEYNLFKEADWMTYISSGRFSLAFLIKIFSLSPFLNCIVAVLLICLAAILNVFLISEIENDKTIKKSVFIIYIGLFISMPYVIGGTFAFATQSPFIALGYCLMAMVIWIFTSISEYKIVDIPKRYLFVGVFFTILAFGIYQAFVPVYIFWVAFIICIKLRKIKDKNELYNLFGYLGKNILFFIISFAGYIIVNKIFQFIIAPPNTYLNDIFVGWNKNMPNSWVLKNAISNWLQILSGSYYNLIAGYVIKISMGIYVAYVVVNILISKKYKLIYLIFIYAVLPVLPFLIPLFCGTFITLGRSLNALPLFLAGIWYLLLSQIDKCRFIYDIAISCAIGLVLLQIADYNKFVYADIQRYENDKKFAYSIMEKVEDIDNYESKPIVFNGSHDFGSMNKYSFTNGCESFFSYGDSNRILCFLGLCGYSITWPTTEQYEEAKIKSANMSDYPAEGSISDEGDYIIINLHSNNE